MSEYETVAFQSSEKTVIYIASRKDDYGQLNLNIRDLGYNISNVTGVILGYDPASSNGLNEMGDLDNKNRVVKRKITEDEYQQLKTLAFFDASNRKHIEISENKYGEVEYKTYLPQFDDIIPKVSNPRTIQDYYFATEIDVDALIRQISEASLANHSDLNFNLAPYEIVQLVIEHSGETRAEAQKAEILALIEKLLPETSDGLEISSDHFEFNKIPIPALPNLEQRETLPTSTDLHNQDLEGTENDDLLSSAAGWDVLIGLAGQDTLIRGNGNDHLDGGTGHDVLRADGGQDTLFGGSGNDTLDGGLGSDHLTGGAGSDSFVFKHFSSGDRDVIADFTIGEDKLFFDLSTIEFSGAQFSPFTITQTSDGLQFSYDDYRLVLEDVTLDSFDFADVVFVN